MRQFARLAALVLCLATPALAVDPIGPINFGLGVDLSRPCSDIDDRAACDSSNMYGDRVGSADVRDGSHRLNEIAVSTNPFTAMFSTIISTSIIQYSVLVGVSGNTIYYSTDTVFTRWSVLFSSLTTPNQKFSFAQAQNNIYMTGDALTDPIFRWDVINSSFSVALATAVANSGIFYAKYLLWEGNYMLCANVRDVRDLSLGGNTTYYDDRIMYSFLLKPSSFTLDRTIDIQQGDGDAITGITSKRSSSVGTRIVMVYKQNSGAAVSFTRLSPAGEGGDQQVTQVAYGFGHATDNPPENIGAWDILCSREGILQWNGGLLTRSNLEAEKIVISGNIKNLIDRLVARGTYHNSLIKYYAKSNYLVFAYEDPDKFPQGRMNSMMFYDLQTSQWWPMANAIVGSMETDKGLNATGKLIYGDGMDGYAHVFDDPADSDDSRKEISVDPMEKTDGWANAGINTRFVSVGTASLTLSMNPAAFAASSMTKVFVVPLGEWYDKSQSSSTDKLSFKVMAASVPFLRSLRIDLQVKDVQGNFDTNFSSVTISSAALTGGSSTWHTIEIALSSFPIRPDWIDFQTESVPFARNLTRFGIRFVGSSIQGNLLYFDDVRLVQATKNPLDPFRTSKRFNFATLANKEWSQIILTRDKQRDGKFFIDVLVGQGEVVNTIAVDREIPQEIFVCGFSSQSGITRLSSIDFSQKNGTVTVAQAFQFDNGAADQNFVYTYDALVDRLVKISRSSFTAFVSTYGIFGTGPTNFNYVQEIAVETPSDGNILLIDHMNHRLKEHKKKDFSFVRQYGSLGIGATSFYNPTGADWDSKNIYVCDDTNQSIKKFSRGYAFLAEAKMDINTIGNCTARVSSEFLYVAYNRGSNEAVYYIDVVLEKRRKTDLSLVSRVTLRPEFSTALSTYSLRGSIALHSKFIYLTFNDNSLTAGNFYLQKRHQSDLSFVDELATTLPMNGVIGDGLAREPSQATERINLEASLSNPYIQFRFYTKNEFESSFKLTEMSVLAVKQSYLPTQGK